MQHQMPIGAVRRFHRSMRWRHGAAAVILVLALTGCQSKAERAVAAATQADALFQQGRLFEAAASARQALAMRDDVGDYWLLLGRIEVAAGHPAQALDAYKHVIELDRQNVEALTMVGQTGLRLGQSADVEMAADQLLLLNPADRGARVMKAMATLQRGDTKLSSSYIDKLLESNPQDVDALVMRSRLLDADGKSAEAAQIMERTLPPGKDAAGGLDFLRRLYTRTGDRMALMHTLERLSALPDASAAVRLDYAGMLYDADLPGRASAVVRQVMESAPDNVEAASRILEMWRDAGSGVPPVADMPAAAAPLSTEMKAVFAERANDLGRPDLATAILRGATGTATDAGTLDAQASLARARALRGDRRGAAAGLAAVLAVDGGHPRALLARAAWHAAARDYRSAIADARRVSADDPTNVTARLALAGLFQASGDDVLAMSALREGVRAAPGNARMAEALVRVLLTKGNEDSARDVLAGLVAEAPTSLRAQRLSARSCRPAAHPLCRAAQRPTTEAPA